MPAVPKPHRSRSSAAIIIAVAGVACGVAAYVLRASFPPFVIIFLFLFLSALFVSRQIKAGKFVVYNAGFVFLALAFSELYLHVKTEFDRTNTDKAYPHTMLDPTYGYVGRPGVWKATKTFGFGRRIVYDVVYSVDENGMRRTGSKPSGRPVVFFGDSLTFGEGLNDNETLPYVFAHLSGEWALNLGMSGYGAHHMLRMLELDLPKRRGAATPQAMIYTASPFHINRAAGPPLWDDRGPHYEVRTGIAEYVGMVNAAAVPRKVPMSLFQRSINHSLVYGLVQSRTTDSIEPSSEANRERFLAIVRKANEIARARYRARLVVVLWDVIARRSGASEASMQDDASWIEQQLIENDILLFRPSKVIPNLVSDEFMILRDGHPNARADGVVAGELLTFLRQVKGSDSATNNK